MARLLVAWVTCFLHDWHACCMANLLVVWLRCLLYGWHASCLADMHIALLTCLCALWLLRWPDTGGQIFLFWTGHQLYPEHLNGPISRVKQNSTDPVLVHYKYYGLTFLWPLAFSIFCCFCCFCCCCCCWWCYRCCFTLFVGCRDSNPRLCDRRQVC